MICVVFGAVVRVVRVRSEYVNPLRGLAVSSTILGPHVSQDVSPPTTGWSA